MTTHRRFLGAIVLCILFLLLLMTWMATRAVSAATSVLVITEVAAEPADGLEWIRVTHIGTSPTDITQWKFLEDGIRHSIKVVGDMSSSISPGDTVIIADDATKLAAVLTTTTPIVDSAWGTLREDGEEIGLINPEGEVVQQFIYQSSGPVLQSEPPPTTAPDQSPPVAADTPTPWVVRINEIAPSPDDGEEWIELFLVSGEYADLTGYTLADAHSTIAQLSLTLTTSSPYGVVTLTRSALNNSGDAVTLLTPDKVELATTRYEDVPGAGVWAYDEQAATYRPSITLTPGALNTIAQAAPTASKSGSTSAAKSESPPASPTVDELRLQLSELLPDPKGADDEDEFIEIWNPTSSTIDLFQWRLRDNRNRSYHFTGTTLEPNARVAIPRSRSAIALANTSGSVALIHPSDHVIDTTSYTRTIAGASWARDNNGFWRYTTSSTPGRENVIRVPHDPPTARIDTTKKVVAHATFYLDAFASISDDGLPLQYSWMLSDGVTSTAPMLQHVFTIPGIYRVQLIVTDSDGLSDRIATDITVTAPASTATAVLSAENSSTAAPANKSAPKKPAKKKSATKKTTTKKPSAKKPAPKTTTVTGTVTAAAGRFGTTMAFIDSHPFLVTLRTKPTTQFASLMIGDRVSLTGTISTQDNIQRLVIKSDAHIRKLPPADLLTPTSSTMTPIRDITIKRYGQLVQAQGTITEFTKRSTYLDDKTGEILIDMGGLGTLSSDVGAGAVVRITGIVRSSTGQPVLATRTPQDLELITAAPPKTAVAGPPRSWTRWLPPSLLALLMTFLYRIYRRKPDVPAAALTYVPTPLTADEVAELVSFHREMRSR